MHNVDSRSVRSFHVQHLIFGVLKLFSFNIPSCDTFMKRVIANNPIFFKNF